MPISPEQKDAFEGLFEDLSGQQWDAIIALIDAFTIRVEVEKPISSDQMNMVRNLYSELDEIQWHSLISVIDAFTLPIDLDDASDMVGAGSIDSPEDCPKTGKWTVSVDVSLAPLGETDDIFDSIELLMGTHPLYKNRNLTDLFREAIREDLIDKSVLGTALYH